jgi:hypothetical protein
MEERLGLLERRPVAQQREQLACETQWQLGFSSAESVEAAALAEEGVRALRDVAELLPLLGGPLVQPGGRVMVAGGFGELRRGGDLGVPVDGTLTAEVAGETFG